MDQEIVTLLFLFGLSIYGLVKFVSAMYAHDRKYYENKYRFY